MDVFSAQLYINLFPLLVTVQHYSDDTSLTAKLVILLFIVFLIQLLTLLAFKNSFYSWVTFLWMKLQNRQPYMAILRAEMTDYRQVYVVKRVCWIWVGTLEWANLTEKDEECFRTRIHECYCMRSIDSEHTCLTAKDFLGPKSSWLAKSVTWPQSSWSSVCPGARSV